jgi:hypothetical protein
VCDQETSKNEKAKARNRAVENTTTVGCNGRKTNKQSNKQTMGYLIAVMVTHLHIYIYSTILLYVRVKVTLEQATKAHRGSGGTVLLFP